MECQNMISGATPDKISLNNDQVIFDYAQQLGYGEFHTKIDAATGLRAIVAIHSTKRGPALGGCRLLEYASIGSAFNDAIRLGQGMTYKAAISNLPLGGGKAVILKPKIISDRTAYFQAFGKFINSLNGRYITAMDSGTLTDDMDAIYTQTPYVTGVTTQGGDPSPHTVLGVRRGIEAAIKFHLKKNTLKGIRVAIQGAGHVGHDLCKDLTRRGAIVSICDVNSETAIQTGQEFEATIVPTESIYDVDCDVFAPCALGGILNEKTIPRLKAAIVAGSANNQLAKPQDANLLHQRNILYAPDYAINAGGLIFAYAQYTKASLKEAKTRIDNIYDTLRIIFERSVTENCSTAIIADQLAIERLV
jgi:leucine dehydrogenase